jgi:hypothetical protein
MHDACFCRTFSSSVHGPVFSGTEEAFSFLHILYCLGKIEKREWSVAKKCVRCRRQRKSIRMMRLEAKETGEPENKSCFGQACASIARVRGLTEL